MSINRLTSIVYCKGHPYQTKSKWRKAVVVKHDGNMQDRMKIRGNTCNLFKVKVFVLNSGGASSMTLWKVHNAKPQMLNSCIQLNSSFYFPKVKGKPIAQPKKWADIFNKILHRCRNRKLFHHSHMQEKQTTAQYSCTTTMTAIYSNSLLYNIFWNKKK